MFVPLHTKSDFSIGYGTASLEDLVGTAASLGYPALALTDLENFYGQVRFHHLCALHQIRAITGVELRSDFSSVTESFPGRFVLLAMNTSGYRNLCRIISIRHDAALSSLSTECCGKGISSLISRFSEGLFILSDDIAALENLLAASQIPRNRAGLLLVRPAEGQTRRDHERTAVRLGIRLVADIDVVFSRSDDLALHLLQVAIREQKRLQEIAELPDNALRSERYLRSPAEVDSLFSDLPNAVMATQEIADACRLSLSDIQEIASASSAFSREESARQLRQLCTTSSSGECLWSPAHQAQFKAELSVFEDLGFSGLFLIVAEILEYCRREGIPATVRGSAVSSITMHLLSGSPVDPLQEGLLFERFLHSGKSSWPDVDIDLPWHRRDEVIDWVYQHFGRARVATVAAYHTFGQRAALREGLKAWGAPLPLIEALSRKLPPADLPLDDFDLTSLAEAAPERFQGATQTNSLRPILSLIQRLIGRPRHIAAHPGGLVIGDEPLSNYLPLQNAPKGVVITQFDTAAMERLGIVKIDLLGNRCLSELEEAFTLAGHPGPLRLESLPRDDPQTLALIDRAETVGCFQLESPAMRSLLRRLPIRSQSDLVAALALIRPGAASGAVKATFIRRARGEEVDELPFPWMEDRLIETHGLFLYEEDIMVLLSRAGGLSLAEADGIRAQIVGSGGEPAALTSVEKGYLQKAETRGDRLAAKEAWQIATRFAAYSFNKAHAASFARLAYLSAYTRAHYPLEWACALLNHHQGIYPLRTLAGEINRLGIRLLGPHVNASQTRTTPEKGSESASLRIGLDKVKHLSRQGVRDIVRERGLRGPFTTLLHLLSRVRLRPREMQALVLSGACDDLSPLSGEDYPFPHEVVLDQMRTGEDPGFAAELRPTAPPAPRDARTRLYQSLVRSRNELSFFEMAPSAHPMALLRPEANRYRCLTIEKVSGKPAGATLKIAAVLATMRRASSGKGSVVFLTLEDETGLLEARIGSGIYMNLEGKITTPGPFFVTGILKRPQGDIFLEVSALEPFHEREKPHP